MQHSTTVEVFEFKGGRPGPTLIMLGSVHGNEPCGTAALRRLKGKIESGEMPLQVGGVILIPVANPGAAAEGKRFLERDLNRSLFPKAPDEIKVYEDKLDNQICAQIDRADYLLDLHSYSVGGAPFCFISGKSAAEVAFAESLGVTRNFVWGWSDAYGVSGVEAKYAWGTTEYSRARAKPAIAVTLECGQHKDATAPDVAYAAAVNALAYLGIVDLAAAGRVLAKVQIPAPGPKQFARMHSVVWNEPATLEPDLVHFSPLKSGQALARRPDGSAIVAPFDGFLIMPDRHAALGEEMGYIGRNEAPAVISA